MQPPTDDYRCLDVHWIMRDRNYHLWISDLLNNVSRNQAWYPAHSGRSHLDIRINTRVLAKRKDIITHVYW